MDKASKILNIVLGLIVVGLLVAGSKGSEKVAPVTREIVASQLAYDGELQLTYADGESQTLWVDMPSIYFEGQAAEVASAAVLENGRSWYELKNGLGVLISEAEGIYELYLPFMEDHSLDYNNKQALINGIKTYSNNFDNYVNETINKDQY